MSDPLSLGGQIGAAATVARPSAAVGGGIGRSRPDEKREDRVEQAEPRQSAATESNGSYRVKLDPETMRVITEVINPGTGEVMFYLPPGYRPSLDAATPADGNGPAGGAGQ
jgi:hypothetical protein